MPHTLLQLLVLGSGRNTIRSCRSGRRDQPCFLPKPPQHVLSFGLSPCAQKHEEKRRKHDALAKQDPEIADRRTERNQENSRVHEEEGRKRVPPIMKCRPDLPPSRPAKKQQTSRLSRGCKPHRAIYLPRKWAKHQERGCGDANWQ